MRYIRRTRPSAGRPWRELHKYWTAIDRDKPTNPIITASAAVVPKRVPAPVEAGRLCHRMEPTPGIAVVSRSPTMSNVRQAPTRW